MISLFQLIALCHVWMEKHLALLSLWASAFNNVGCIARDLSADLFGGRFWVEEG